MLRLYKVTFARIPALPGIRAGDLSTLDLDNPAQPLLGWRIVLRGHAMFMISPPGWTPQTMNRPMDRDPKGPSVVHEIPRNDVFLHWSADEEGLDAIAKGGKFETPPFGPKPQPVEAGKPILAQIPANQIGD